MAKRNITKQAAALAALDARNGSVSKLASELNVSRQTIYDWKNKAKADPELATAVQLEKQELAGRFFTLASNLADRLTGAVPDATWDNKAVQGLQVAVDKWLALTGQAQSITETRVSGQVDITLEARRAVELYRQEGFSEQEAVEALQEDDPELWRALVSAGNGQA